MFLKLLCGLVNKIFGKVIVLKLIRSLLTLINMDILGAPGGGMYYTYVNIYMYTNDTPLPVHPHIRFINIYIYIYI